MKIVITESQYNKINEIVAGYDDAQTLATHGGKIMGVLFGYIKDLTKLFQGIDYMLNDEDLTYIDLKENLKEVIDVIDEVIDAFKIGFKDFSEKSLIISGISLMKTLRKLQENIRVFIDLGPEVISKESILEKLNDMTKESLLKLINFINSHDETHIKIKNVIDKHRYRPRRDY